MVDKGMGPLELARKIIEHSALWKRCKATGSVGRSWGARGKDNHCAMPGSQIMLSDGLVVIIIYSKDGKRHNPVEIKRFGESEISIMEKEIVEMLATQGLINTEMEAPALVIG